MVHSSNLSGIEEQTFEDELFEKLDEKTFRTSTNEKGRTIAYGIWHSTRAEDITMNILVAGDKQIFHTDHWQQKNKFQYNGYGKCNECRRHYGI